MTEYGPVDSDLSAYNKVLELSTPFEVMYILHHARVSLNARSCQWPGSVKVQAVLVGNKIITVTQLADGQLNIVRNWNDAV